MLDFIPLSPAGGEVTDGKRQLGLIRQFLQFQLPEPQARAIAPTAVRGDENLLRLGIQPPAFKAPLTPN